jgi:hypothetical protein
MATARGWRWRDKVSLLRASLAWQRAGFACAPALSVAQLCASVAPRVRQELIEPLCVSALNTPAADASAQVFLRVLQDALFGLRGGSHLLLPRTDLSALLPHAAAHWLTRRGVQVRRGQRVQQLAWQAPDWRVNGERYDRVIWATDATEAARTFLACAHTAPEPFAQALRRWTATASALRYEAIATVYARGPEARLPHAMLALRSTPTAPAQFVFDRGQLGGPRGLLAFVVSASSSGREALQAAVLAQGASQLGLTGLQPVQTVVEKRATFACTPALVRPTQAVVPGLLAAGDYVEGPYPATLEGAVRSGWAAGNLTCIKG